MEIQRGKLPMHEQKYCSEIGATAACTLRLVELTYQPEGIADGDLKQVLKGDAWFW